MSAVLSVNLLSAIGSTWREHIVTEHVPMLSETSARMYQKLTGANGFAWDDLCGHWKSVFAVMR